MAQIDNALSPGVSAAGDVILSGINLIDVKNKNTKYDLIGMFIDFTVYEDLFSPAMTGYVALIESQNLISQLPITGGELIEAEFKTTSSTSSFNVLFSVSKIGMREQGDKKNAYTLELISLETYQDINSRVSKSFSGNPTSIVQNLYKSSFGKSLLDFDQCDNFIKFVSPYWGPYKIMNHAATRALQPNNKMVTPNFLFYQTNKGHKFKSLTTLFSQKPIMEYFFDKNPARIAVSKDDKTSVRDIGREYSSVRSIEFIASQDYVKNMLDGAYNHKVFTLNLFNKKFDIKTYSYTNDFGSTAHTDKFRLNVIPASSTSGLNTIHHTYPNVFDGVTDVSDEIIAKRISLLAQLETWKLGLRVPGKTDMEVGQTVNFWMNKFSTVDATDKFKNEYDPIYSGKYLITAIQHRFTMAKHEMNLELIKDSSFTQIDII